MFYKTDINFLDIFQPISVLYTKYSITSWLCFMFLSLYRTQIYSFIQFALCVSFFFSTFNQHFVKHFQFDCFSQLYTIYRWNKHLRILFIVFYYILESNGINEFSGKIRYVELNLDQFYHLFIATECKVQKSQRDQRTKVIKKNFSCPLSNNSIIRLIAKMSMSMLWCWLVTIRTRV